MAEGRPQRGVDVLGVELLLEGLCEELLDGDELLDEPLFVDGISRGDGVLGELLLELLGELLLELLGELLLELFGDELLCESWPDGEE